MHGLEWTAYPVQIQEVGGVHSHRALTGNPQLEPSMEEKRRLLAASHYTLASPDMLKAVVESCLINKVAHREVLSGWPCNRR